MLRSTLRAVALASSSLVLLFATASPSVAQDAGTATAQTRPRMLHSDSVAIAMTRQYPAEYEAMGAGGLVRLRAFVDTAGRAERIHVTSSTGYSRLDRAAVWVLHGARFAPAQGADGPVGTWIDTRLQFGERAAGGPGDEVPAPVERAAQTAAAQVLYPASLRGKPFGVDVPFAITVASDGSVASARSPDPGCFTEAVGAASRIVRGLRFEPSSHDVRHTAATITFFDSVAIRLRGDDLTPQPTARREQTDPAPLSQPAMQRPNLANHRQVRDALVRNYPPALRDAGMGATSVIWFHINAEGVVTQVQVSRTSGICEFDLAAMNVGAIMRFTPALADGRPVAIWVEIPIIFSAR